MSGEKTASDLLSAATRIVVKVGSSLVANGNIFRHDGLAGDLASWDKPLVLISSGAVAVGRQAAPDLAPDTLSARQALSAIGQPLLMAKWEQSLGGANARTAQILLTPDVTDDPVRSDNARATLEEVLSAQLLPIVNENDTVATDELRYGDNDRLAVQTAQLIGADLLVLLSDVAGLFDADPSQNPDAAHWPIIPAEVLANPDAHVPDTASAHGTGGMRSKITAAALSAKAGVPAIIASGRPQRPLTALKQGSAKASLDLPN